MKILLKTNKLRREFTTDDITVVALNDINTEIHQGEFTVIMGPSGSGKSTLLYNLSGLDRSTAGDIIFQDKNISTMKEKQLSTLRKKNFGFVFQYLTLIQNLTIMENLLIPGYLIDKNRNRVEEKAMEILKTLGIENLCERQPTQVSGGQQQRAAVARALINSPDILFADEPTGALNYKMGQELLSYLYKLKSSGQTIVMVTHDIKAASWADRVLYLRDGSIHGEFRFDENTPGPDQGLEQRELKLFTWLSGMGW